MKDLKRRWARLMEKPLCARLWQFVKFGVVGVSNTLISLCVYEACVHLLGLHYLAANLIGLCISVINAYYWNNRCVFGTGEKRTPWQHVGMYLRSLAAYGGTFAL
ncbi:MAG: GtrA family protein, partial [Clostridiales bacterium]|nr:GtrA family protein [Clostridiales bacterium]